MTVTTTKDVQKMRSTLSHPAAAPGATLRHAATDDELPACFPAMSESRPHLREPEQFVAACRRMKQDGYRILAAWDQDDAVAVAGYRLGFSISTDVGCAMPAAA